MSSSFFVKNAFLLAALSSGTVMLAQQPYGQYRGYDPNGYAQYGGAYQNDLGYRRGFDDGMRSGQKDLQTGKRNDPTKSDSYEDAPGYNSSYGDKGRWKQQYRQGFTTGYQNATSGGANGGYGQKPYDRGSYDQPGYGQTRYSDDPGYRRGFDDGMRIGESDVQGGRRWDPTKSDSYEDAPGYDSTYGDKGQWKQQYRQGFALGYQRAMDGRTGGAYGQRPYDQRGNGQPRYDDPGFRRGFDDGMRSAQKDLQTGKRNDPTKSESYEDAPGYNSSYGDKGQWKQQYRQGFTTGYQNGMSGGAYGRNGQRPYGQGEYGPPQ
ncbi:MAG: hypothetical protein M3O31_16530 [Acidobacteriota bacterium]|nr:hypothetical protein [Acidobacteriota bacterium]